MTLFTGARVHGIQSKLRWLTLCGLLIRRGAGRHMLRTHLDARRIACKNCMRVKKIKEAD